VQWGLVTHATQFTLRDDSTAPTSGTKLQLELHPNYTCTSAQCTCTTTVRPVRQPCITSHAQKLPLLRPTAPALPPQEASGVLAEVAELTSQNQSLNKTFMALAGASASRQDVGRDSQAVVRDVDGQPIACMHCAPCRSTVHSTGVTAGQSWHTSYLQPAQRAIHALNVPCASLCGKCVNTQ
jgi:hypothetical protein